MMVDGMYSPGLTGLTRRSAPLGKSLCEDDGPAGQARGRQPKVLDMIRTSETRDQAGTRRAASGHEGLGHGRPGPVGMADGVGRIDQKARPRRLGVEEIEP